MGVEPVAIIGAGPSGLITALQLFRYGIKALVFEGQRIGGLLHNANLVENYPGFPGGIPGPALVELFIRQARQIGVEIIPEQVIALDYQRDVFQLETQAGNFMASLVVIASGTQPVNFSVGLISDEVRDLVFYEVFPLLNVNGKHIVIVGAGDAAFDYALNLARRNEITILNRGDKVKCLPLLWDRVHKEPRIRYLSNYQLVCARSGEQHGLALECAATGTKERFTLVADYLLGALGRQPRLGFLSVNLKDRAVELEKQQRLFFVGDVKNGLYRQTAIAVGDGLRAAMSIYQYLKENKG